MTLDLAAFRATLGRFATGVTVVTTSVGGQRVGITVNAFTSVSLDPPLVLVCIDRSSRAHQALLESRTFAVNILSERQQELAMCFASNSEERYADFCHAEWRVEATGAPVIAGCIGFVDCRVVDVFPGGDHSIFIGQVEALGMSEGEPLLYFRSAYAHAHRHTASPAERAQ